MKQAALLPPLSSSSSSNPVAFGRGTLQVCRRGKDGNILLVALHRLQVRNAFNDETYLDLVDLLHLTAKDPSIAAIVLTGSGSFFSSGADLKANGGLTAALEEAETSVVGRQVLHKPAGRFMMALIAYPKVLAAAVQGHAVGIATTLLMHCDLVHLSSKATLWAPFSRLALVPELCSSQTFLHTMGLSKANEMLLLGKPIDAQKAYEWNLCSHVDTSPTTNLRDPFHPQSLANKLVQELDKHLLQLPGGPRTAEYFVNLIKGSRRLELERVCREELLKLDERFNTGQVREAAKHLQIGSSARSTNPKSRL